jgi:flagellar biosynthesis protein FlhF
MRIKSYFADSVQDAIEKARAELGPDAMLMNSKKTDFELRALGSVEVVFGLPGPAAVAKPRLQIKGVGDPRIDSVSFAGALAEASSVASDEVTQELADLRRQIETVKRSVNRRQRAHANPDERNTLAVENICSRLIASDLSEDLAQEIAEAVELQAFAWQQGSTRGLRDFEMVPSETLELALLAELERRFQVAPELGTAGATNRRVMFVGPSGGGKTTCLIKLGLRFGLQARLPMHIFSLDTLRVGGWEQLAAYAAIAGVGFDAAHSLKALDQMLSQHADKKLILMDTPGFGPADTDDLGDLGRWIGQRTNLDIQMVIPATLRQPVIKRTLERFAPLKPSKLLLTRADETESVGVLLDIAMRSSLPLSYISNGQTIPEDVEEACKPEMLARLNVRKLKSGSQEAA